MRVDLKDTVAFLRQFRRVMRSPNRLLVKSVRPLVNALVEEIATPLSRAIGLPITFKLGKPGQVLVRQKRRMKRGMKRRGRPPKVQVDE